MKIRHATISKTGRRRNNEDAFKVIDLPEINRFMGIVCDGMGGHSFGEIASDTVCNTIADFWMKYICMQDSDSKVYLACKKASSAIDQKTNELHHAEMGTTMVMASIENDVATTLRILEIAAVMYKDPMKDYSIRQKTISVMILEGKQLPSASSLTVQMWLDQIFSKSS